MPILTKVGNLHCFTRTKRIVNEQYLKPLLGGGTLRGFQAQQQHCITIFAQCLATVQMLQHVTDDMPGYM